MPLEILRAVAEAGLGPPRKCRECRKYRGFRVPLDALLFEPLKATEALGPEPLIMMGGEGGVQVVLVIVVALLAFLVVLDLRLGLLASCFCFCPCCSCCSSSCCTRAPSAEILHLAPLNPKP